MAPKKSAFILGYTGETGQVLVQELVTANVFSRIVLIGRRNVQYDDDNLQKLEQRVVDFDNIDDHKEAFEGLDIGFCCLGTTKGKAGKAGFLKVDHDYVVNSARVAKSCGCQYFCLMSSTGANAGSCFLYPKTKGRVEETLKEIKFEHLSIFRPGFLLCDRAERRAGESCMMSCLKPWIRCSPTSISVPVVTVAKAMVCDALLPGSEPSVTLDNKTIHRTAARLEAVMTEVGIQTGDRHD